MRYLLSIFLFLTTICHAADWQENSDIAALFENAGVTGTFVVWNAEQHTYTGYNRSRAAQRFVPASTFKIANTLIGLKNNSVASVEDILPYGGKPQPFPAWGHDMSLRDAIAISNVPIYQELARRIGLDNMQAGIDLLDYGNQEIGQVVDRFWLDGPLQISAIEQTQFLYQLATEQLIGFSSQHQRDTKAIVLLERTSDYTLYGKTGWENAPGPGAGWWVGWVERDDTVYPFAFNMQMRSMDDAALRLTISKAALKLLGLLD